MSTAELKSYLHKLVVETNEDAILQQVAEYFASLKDQLEDDLWSTLSEGEKKSIERGIDDLRNGRSIPHETVMRDAQEIIDNYKKSNE